MDKGGNKMKPFWPSLAVKGMLTLTVSLFLFISDSGAVQTYPSSPAGAGGYTAPAPAPATSPNCGTYFDPTACNATEGCSWTGPPPPATGGNCT